MNCPQPATIADLVDRRLSPLEISDVERHLDGCSRCAELVAVAVSSRGDTAAETVVPGGGTVGDAARRETASLIPPGTQLGRYQVRRWIGRGGMGDVYEGFDPKLERRVAIKLLRGRGSDGPAAQRRLEREAKTLARLSSANVVAALDIGIYADRVFLVMELVEGPTLAGWQRAAPRTWRQILDAFLEAGDGLAAAHEVGIIHRDFKPQNVLIGADGKARVSDFGLARASEVDAVAGENGAPGFAEVGDERQTLTEAGALIGTPRYMAPEQFLRQPADVKADQFSFCVALYEALYGGHPFAAEGAAKGSVAGALDTLKKAVLSGRPAAPPRNAQAPRSIAAVLTRGMARNPEDRFPSLREAIVAVRASAETRTKRRLRASIAIAVAVATTGMFALRKPAATLLEATGEPADWTDARIVFRVSDRIHCVMPLSATVVRVTWGNPRRVQDIDVSTGVVRPTNLLPITYRHDCPVVSPDGTKLIYEGYDARDQPKIFYSANPAGLDAEPIVSCLEPTYDSQPSGFPRARNSYSISAFNIQPFFHSPPIASRSFRMLNAMRTAQAGFSRTSAKQATVSLSPRTRRETLESS